MVKLPCLSMMSICLISVAANADTWQQQSVACTAKASYITLKNPKATWLGNGSPYEFSLLVEEDSSGNTRPAQTGSQTVAGQQITFTAAGLTWVTASAESVPDEHGDIGVPGVNIQLSSDQVKAILTALNKGNSLALPKGDASVTMPSFPLIGFVTSTPYIGQPRHLSKSQNTSIGFAPGERSDGLTYDFVLTCETTAGIAAPTNPTTGGANCSRPYDFHFDCDDGTRCEFIYGAWRCNNGVTCDGSFPSDPGVCSNT